MKKQIEAQNSTSFRLGRNRKSMSSMPRSLQIKMHYLDNQTKRLGAIHRAVQCILQQLQKTNSVQSLEGFCNKIKKIEQEIEEQLYQTRLKKQAKMLDLRDYELFEAYYQQWVAHDSESLQKCEEKLQGAQELRKKEDPLLVTVDNIGSLLNDPILIYSKPNMSLINQSILQSQQAKRVQIKNHFLKLKLFFKLQQQKLPCINFFSIKGLQPNIGYRRASNMMVQSRWRKYHSVDYQTIKGFSKQKFSKQPLKKINLINEEFVNQRHAKLLAEIDKLRKQNYQFKAAIRKQQMMQVSKLNIIETANENQLKENAIMKIILDHSLLSTNFIDRLEAVAARKRRKMFQKNNKSCSIVNKNKPRKSSLSN